MRLSRETSPRLPDDVARPAYDRDRQARRIVHFGLGAFARAHLAVYTDAAMARGDTDWMITGVSLRSAGVADQLDPQDGLYLVGEKSGAGTAYRMVGAVREVLVARRDPEAVIAALADPGTSIASFTVTEKGYCRAANGGLDPEAAEAGSFYPLLTEALKRRRAAGEGGLTLLSCDNLAGNGGQLSRLMRGYLERFAPELEGWFADNCRCPSTMVDRIVPATADADRDAAEQATGLRDEGLVVTEPFTQWVIEDGFASDRPQLEVGGAQIVGDVAPYETAKLRMLNGAHSLLAYCGLEAGHEYVHEAIADPRLRSLARALMEDEAAPTIAAAPGQDLAGYARSLVKRFENPALRHRLAQIAMDGSQKIPQRWLATLAQREARGLRSPAILAGLGAWLRHVRGDFGTIDDPLAGPLAEAWQEAGPDGIVLAVFGEDGLVRSDWRPDESTARLVDLKPA